MRLTDFLCIVLVCPFIFTTDAVNYCSLTCALGGDKTSGCDCSSKKGCKEVKLTYEEQEYVVNLHNELRQNVASGAHDKAGLKSATNMMVLNYDSELEYVAQCWANKCTSTRDTCRRTDKFTSPGQNFFNQLGKTRCESKYIFKEAVLMWFSEVRDSNPSCIQASGSCNKIVGHLTQVIWAETTHVGCGRVKFDDGTCNLYCNYGPGGNVMQMPVYKSGSAASACPNNIVNSQYKALCGEQSDSSIRSAGTRPSTVQIPVLIFTFLMFVSLYVVSDI